LARHGKPRYLQPEILVKGKVVIIGLADYVRKGDKIEIIADSLKDDDGKPAPKGTKGVITSYDAYNVGTPFVADMENGIKITLPAGSFMVIPKRELVKSA
jgi:hypothetical protein